MSLYSFHAGMRISERCSLSLVEISNIIKNDRFTRLGMDLKKKNVCHYMFYSVKDSDFFILVVDEKNNEVITMLYGAGHHQWRIDPNLFYFVRDVELTYCIANNIYFNPNYIYTSTIEQIVNVIPNSMSKEWEEDFNNIVSQINDNIGERVKQKKLINKENKEFLKNMLIEPINNYIQNMHKDDLKKFKKLLNEKMKEYATFESMHHIYKFYIQLINNECNFNKPIENNKLKNENKKQKIEVKKYNLDECLELLESKHSDVKTKLKLLFKEEEKYSSDTLLDNERYLKAYYTECIIITLLFLDSNCFHMNTKKHNPNQEFLEYIFKNIDKYKEGSFEYKYCFFYIKMAKNYNIKKMKTKCKSILNNYKTYDFVDIKYTYSHIPKKESLDLYRICFAILFSGIIKTVKSDNRFSMFLRNIESGYLDFMTEDNYESFEIERVHNVLNKKFQTNKQFNFGISIQLKNRFFEYILEDESSHDLIKYFYCSSLLMENLKETINDNNINIDDILKITIYKKDVGYDYPLNILKENFTNECI